MALSLRTALRTARSTEINTDLGASAVVKLYTGTAPASVNDTATGTLLAECTCNATAFGTVTSGVLEADVVSGESYVAYDSSANASGTVGYARLCQSGGTAVAQVSTVGTTGSGQEIIMPSLSITSTNPVQIDSITITEGNA